MSKIAGNLQKGDLFRLASQGLDVIDLFVKKKHEWGRMSKDESSPLFEKYVNHTEAEDYFYDSIQYLHPKNYPFLNPNPSVDLKKELIETPKEDYPLKREYHAGFTPDDVARTILEYVVRSDEPYHKQKKDLMNWIFFAALSDVLLTYLAAVSDGLLKTHGVGHSNPAENDNDGFITMITGGMSLRSYYASHYSADIDVKLFPKHMKSSMKPEIVLRDIQQWDLTQTFMEYLKKHGHILIMIYLQTIIEFPQVQDIPLVRDIYNEFFDFYTMLVEFHKTNGYVENATMMNERGVPVVAFNVLFEQPPGPRTLYKCTIVYKGNYYQLMDMSVYDKEDTTYNALITTVRNRLPRFDPATIRREYGEMYTLRDPEEQMIPFRIVPVLYHMKDDSGEKRTKTYFHIPTKQFLKVEKEILKEDLQGNFLFNEEAQYNESLRRHLMKKFNRTLQTFVDGRDRPRTYVGGKRRKKTRNGKRAHQKKSYRKYRKHTRKHKKY